MNEDWRLEAACRGVPTEIFFPRRPEKGEHYPRLVPDPRYYCSRCPVKVECKEAGMTENFGIWGGTSERQRKILRRKRMIQAKRPPDFTLKWTDGEEVG